MGSLSSPVATTSPIGSSQATVFAVPPTCHGRTDGIGLAKGGTMH